MQDRPDQDKTRDRLTQRTARELLVSITAVRGAALALSRDSPSLTAEQHAQLVSVVGDQSAEAIAILRQAIGELSSGADTRAGAL